MNSEGDYCQYENNFKGFKKFVKELDETSDCVMESTGYYHKQLAYFLLEKEVKVSVENPIFVKRFIQMKLSKIKTDKSDALEHQDLLTRIETIPGLGKKTSIMLLILTDGFERFSSSGELCFYAGFNPNDNAIRK